MLKKVLVAIVLLAILGLVSDGCSNLPGVGAKDEITDSVPSRGSNYDDASSVQQTSDGGFIIVGETDSFGAGLDDLLLFKVVCSQAVGKPMCLTIIFSSFGGSLTLHPRRHRHPATGHQARKKEDEMESENIETIREKFKNEWLLNEDVLKRGVAIDDYWVEE